MELCVSHRIGTTWEWLNDGRNGRTMNVEHDWIMFVHFLNENNYNYCWEFMENMLIHSFQALMCTFIPYFKKSNSVYQISAGIHPVIHACWQTHTKQLSLLIWWVFSSWVGVIGLGDSTSDSVLWCGRARRRERESSRENIYRTHTHTHTVTPSKRTQMLHFCRPSHTNHSFKIL